MTSSIHWWYITWNFMCFVSHTRHVLCMCLLNEHMLLHCCCCCCWRSLYMLSAYLSFSYFHAIPLKHTHHFESYMWRIFFLYDLFSFDFFLFPSLSHSPSSSSLSIRFSFKSTWLVVFSLLSDPLINFKIEKVVRRECKVKMCLSISTPSQYCTHCTH